jgi:MFS family permease
MATSDQTVGPTLRANRWPFIWLAINVLLVGATLGVERTVVPLLGHHVYHIGPAVALTFITSFGFTKALINVGAGRWSDRVGRRPILRVGWAAGIPLVVLLITVHHWWAVIVANVFLGANQGFAWTMTVTAQLDLVEPGKRGLAMGVNEAMGYLGVAGATVAAGLLGTHGHLATRPFIFTAGVVVVGLAMSLVVIRETRPQAGQSPAVPAAQTPFAAIFHDATWRHPALAALTAGGFLNKVVDTAAWGVLPLYLARQHESLATISLIAGLYGGIWGFAQFGTGLLSDYTGRKPLIVVGLVLLGGGLAAMVSLHGTVGWSLAAAVMGLGMALVYPVLNAAVADVATPQDRGAILGVYRLWRDGGYAVGGLGIGLLMAAVGMRWSLGIVSGLVLVGALFLSMRLPETHRKPGPPP